MNFQKHSNHYQNQPKNKIVTKPIKQKKNEKTALKSQTLTKNFARVSFLLQNLLQKIDLKKGLLRYFSSSCKITDEKETYSFHKGLEMLYFD